MVVAGLIYKRLPLDIASEAGLAHCRPTGQCTRRNFDLVPNFDKEPLDNVRMIHRVLSREDWLETMELG